MAYYQRPLPRRALALTVTALVALPAPAALAQADTRDPTGAALQAERYYNSYGEPADGETAALATERYLSSYGTPQPPTTSTSTVTADAGPTWTAAIIIGTLLTVIAAGIGILAGRASMRPRHVTA
jgi:hypothetical protein